MIFYHNSFPTTSYSTLEYIERDGNEKYCRLSTYESVLHKKVTLLKYFRNYMSEHLLKVYIQSVGPFTVTNYLKFGSRSKTQSFFLPFTLGENSSGSKDKVIRA